MTKLHNYSDPRIAEIRFILIPVKKYGRYQISF